MEQQVDTKKLILKTKQYEFTDGLREIQTGVTFIFIGVFWSWLTFQPNWWGYLFRLKENYGEWVFKTIEISVFLLPLIISLGIKVASAELLHKWKGEGKL